MPQRYLRYYHDAGLLVIRIGLGLAFIFVHGDRKLFGGPDVWAQYGESMQYLGITFLPTFWGFMAGLAEFVGGLLLLLGLFFRPALVLLLPVMVVAATKQFITGGGSPWHPIELGIVFLGLFVAGPGAYSLDHKLRDRRRAGF